MVNELIGITATCFILLAFLCNTEKNIRLLDMVGAVLFVVYGLLTRTWSTMGLNIALIIIQLFKLHGIKRRNTMKLDNQLSRAKGADTD